jgi:rSAM/selenodomain-associated transferase 2
MLSIIVPVLNEARVITALLEQLAPLRTRGAEVIVVDGGSSDETLAIAAALADGAIASGQGRAAQMNAGAAAASGDTLLFLHADTRLPDNADRLIEASLAAGHAWGRFDVRIEGRHPMLGVVACMMNLRSRLSGIATGDQGMFMRRETFNAAGGFPPLALMEDIALSRRLRAVSPPACIAARAVTSGRRWERHGVWRTIVLMWWLRFRYFLGADPEQLARHYRREPG